MLQIRKIKPEDISFVLELVSENKYPLGKLLSNLDGFVICENEGIKCGCGCITVSEGTGYMNWIIVKEGNRRNNLGTAIVKALLNIADLKGVKEVYSVDNCKEFLKVLGFEKCENTSAIDGIKRVFGSMDTSDCCRVSLDGYFKPCSERQR